MRAGRENLDVGDPVHGGSASVIQLSEPRTLDPAGMANNHGTHGFLGNALYGTLMINDPETLEMEYVMAKDFSTADGGSTFILTLRPGLEFSDGSPLDAEAVKFNWDRLADPKIGSGSARYAAQIRSNEVLDGTTLKSTMVSPNPHFAQAIIMGAMNWIASPSALQKGREPFDANPVGAGPFTLANWSRQDSIDLVRNPTYWDSPKPYLDAVTIRAVSGADQRFSTVSTGGADLSFEVSWKALKKSDDAGLVTETVPVGGGQYLAMNFRRSPFDDRRARLAVSMAVNVDWMNLSVFNGAARIPETLFGESSPYYVDVPLKETDEAQAQSLFDELASEGRPVSFTITTTTSPEGKTAAESVQAQLRAFDGVEVDVQYVDSTSNLALQASHDFDMNITAANIQDPDVELMTQFFGGSKASLSGIDDPELNRALVAGRVATNEEERKEAYRVVAERISSEVPGIWYTRTPPSVIAATDVHGIDMYGIGSLLPQELWMDR